MSNKDFNDLMQSLAKTKQSLMSNKDINDLKQLLAKLRIAHDFYLFPKIEKHKDAWQWTCDFYQDNGKITEAFKTSLKQYLDLFKKGFFPSGILFHCFHFFDVSNRIRYFSPIFVQIWFIFAVSKKLGCPL
jgi:hypothetical protein